MAGLVGEGYYLAGDGRGPVPGIRLDNKFSIDIQYIGMGCAYLGNRRLYSFQMFAWTASPRESIRLKNVLSVERDTVVVVTDETDNGAHACTQVSPGDVVGTGAKA